MSIPPWVERTFSFDFSANLYLTILARFRGTPARLEDAVQGLTREFLIARPERRWSIQENAGHLLDEEELFHKRLDEFLAGADTLTPAPYLQRELTHNGRNIDDILREFRLSREEQVRRLIALRPEDFTRTAWHERLKQRIRLVDHVFFFAEHDDHHLARIWILRAQ